MSNRRESNQALHVGLRQTAECAVDDANDGEDCNGWRPRLRALGQHRDGDADKAVGSQLQQDRGQNDRALRRCLGVSVGQPGVEREHRHLDGKPEEHAGKDPDLYVAIDSGAHLDEVGESKALAAGLEEEGQEGNKHECRAEHRVEEEFQRGVLAIFAAPDTDHEVHRKQNNFEEDEEQDEVLADERAGHSGLQHQHQDVERLGVARVRHVVPGVDHHEERDAHRQEVQREADAVKADRVTGADHFNPLGVDGELQFFALGVVELRERVDAHEQCCPRRGDANALDAGLVVLGPEHHHQHTDERQEGAERQQEVLICQCFHDSVSLSSR